MPNYKPVTSQIVGQLVSILGQRNVLTAPEQLEAYACDEMATRKPHLPDVVVKPGSTREVAQMLALANQARIPVTPRGGGTGLSGGAVPIFGGHVPVGKGAHHLEGIRHGNQGLAALYLFPIWQTQELLASGTLRDDGGRT